MAKYHHRESDLQIRCVKYFRIKYPAFARLLEHPKNEGCGHSKEDRMRQAISKAEGVNAGTADLILHVPSLLRYYKGELQEEPYLAHSLAIEMKEKKGRQSEEQKLFQRYFEAAGGVYLVIRSFEDFQREIDDWMGYMPINIYTTVTELHKEVEEERTAAARAELQRIINKA